MNQTSYLGGPSSDPKIVGVLLYGHAPNLWKQPFGAAGKGAVLTWCSRSMSRPSSLETQRNASANLSQQGSGSEPKLGPNMGFLLC